MPLELVDIPQESTPPLKPGSGGVERPRELKLEFRGSAWEYFRIWAVNLCLTLLTFGIFSAWAKVRKKRYFYASTVIDGTPFQYLGQPLPILKGRIVAVILFLAYYISSHFFLSTLPFVLLAVAVLAPWVIVRSAAFNARYSAFRNMTFSFNGGYWDVFKILYLRGLLLLITLGLAFPWWTARFKRYIAAHTRFGSRDGDLALTGKQLFKIYFVAALIIFGLLFIVIFAGSGLAVWLKNAKYAGVLIVVLAYAAYVLAYAYVQARTGNIIWNNIRLGPLRFQSTLQARGMAKLYTANAFGIIASLGLLIPWAVMRTLKYRIDNMRVMLEGKLTEFTGGSAPAVLAAGAEVGEFFDLDLSL